MSKAEHSDVDYWRNLADKYKKNYEAAQEEMEEFQTESRQLEQELERNIELLEKKNTELDSSNQRLLRERDMIRERLDDVQSDARKQVSRIEEELRTVTQQRDEMHKAIRELEQTNDDLERAKRNVGSLLDDLERKMNETLERNALLESEVDEKELLQASIQRLKEETRDLRQEIQVRQTSTTDTTSTTPPPTAAVCNGVDRHRSTPSSSLFPAPSPATNTTSAPMEVDPSTPTPQNGLRSIPRSQTVDGSVPFSINGTAGDPQRTPITPAGRISALNIVGDLLRKVSALEMKLSACRKYSRGDDKTAPHPKQPHLSAPVAPPIPTKSAKKK